MNRILTIGTFVLKNWLKSKTGVFFSILFPVMLLLVFGAIFGGGGSSSFGIYVQNFDVQSDGAAMPISGAFISALNSSKVIIVSEIIPNNVSDPVKYAQDKMGFFGGSPRVMVIPKGFNDKLVNGSLRTRITVVNSTLQILLYRFAPYLNSSDIKQITQGLSTIDNISKKFSDDNTTITLILDQYSTSTPVVESIISSFAQSFNYQMIGAKPLMTFDIQNITLKKVEAIDYYLPGYIGAFIMSNGLMGAAQSTSEFRRRGVLKRLATTPLTKFEWVMGNVVAQTVLGFLLTGVMILTGFLFFNVTVLPNLLTIILIFSGAVAFSGMALVLAGALKDVEAVSAAGSAITFPMMFLSGSFIPLETMPSYMQTLAQLLPLTYLSNGLRDSLITGEVYSVLFNLAIVSIFGIIMIALGSKLTKWQDL